MPKIKGIIFDLGDTLIFFDDSLPAIMSQANSILAKCLEKHLVISGQERFLEIFQARMANYYRERDTEFIEYTSYYILQESLADLGINGINETTLRKCLSHMYEIFQAHWQPVTGGVEVLAELKNQGYRLALVSNTADDANVQALVDKIKVRPFFDQIITSAVMKIRKPNPRIFDPVLREWALPPHQVAMVGDTLGADILGAKNANMFSVWVTQYADTPANQDHRDTIHPDAIIENLFQLPALLAKIAETER
jgi:HAD superfamily hydrolase (TIGR01662 family)